MDWCRTINSKRRSTVLLWFLSVQHDGCYCCCSCLLLRLPISFSSTFNFRPHRCSSESSVSGSRSAEERYHLLETVNGDVSHRRYLFCRLTFLTDQFKKLLNAVNPSRRSFSQGGVFHICRKAAVVFSFDSNATVAVHHKFHSHISQQHTPL